MVIVQLLIYLLLSYGLIMRRLYELILGQIVTVWDNIGRMSLYKLTMRGMLLFMQTVSRLLLYGLTMLGIFLRESTSMNFLY